MSKLKYLRQRYELLLSLPAFIVVFGLVICPLVGAFLTAAKSNEGSGDFTFTNIWEIINDRNLSFLLPETLFISLLCTIISIIVSLPLVYYMASAPYKIRMFLLILVMASFWTSFLIRIFSWKILLHPDGILKLLLYKLGLVNSDTVLLYGNGALLLVTVHVSVPFATIPMFASAANFDFSLMESAEDLGASKMQAFFKVFLPSIHYGIFQSAILVFLMVDGSYVFSEIIGGASCEFLGNRIVRKFLLERDLVTGCAISVIFSVVLSFVVFLIYSFYKRVSNRFSHTSNGHKL